VFISHYNDHGIKLVRPLSTVDNTRDYARVSHSRQWSNYNFFKKPSPSKSSAVLCEILPLNIIYRRQAYRHHADMVTTLRDTLKYSYYTRNWINLDET